MSASWLPALSAAGDVWALTMGRATVQGGVAALVVWVLCRTVPSLPGATRCWLWRLVYLRLLLALCWPHALELPLLPAPPPVSAPLSAPLLVKPDRPAPLLAFPPVVNTPADATAGKVPPVLLPVKPSPAWSLWLAALWSVGVGGCTVRVIRQCRRAARLREQTVCLEDPQLLERWQTLCERAGIRHVPELRCLGTLDGPMLLGGVRPMVVLPLDLLREWSPKQLELALAHEVAHIKRGDLLWSWLPALAHIGFYFHPLFWLADREWRLAQELACDAQALRLTRSPASEYALMLVRLAHRRSQVSAPALAGALWVASESPDCLRRRLEAMKFEGLSQRRAVFLGGAIVAVAGVLSIPFRVVAQSPPRSPSSARPPEAPVVQVREKPDIKPHLEVETSPSPLSTRFRAKSPAEKAREEAEYRQLELSTQIDGMELNEGDQQVLSPLLIVTLQRLEQRNRGGNNGTEEHTRSLERALVELTVRQVRTNARLRQEEKILAWIEKYLGVETDRPLIKPLQADMVQSVITGSLDPQALHERLRAARKNRDGLRRKLEEQETQAQALMTSLRLAWGAQPPASVEVLRRDKYERDIVRARLWVVDEELERARRDFGPDHPRVWEIQSQRDALATRLEVEAPHADQFEGFDATSEALHVLRVKEQDVRRLQLCRQEQDLAQTESRLAAEAARQVAFQEKRHRVEIAKQQALATAARRAALEADLAAAAARQSVAEARLRASVDAFPQLQQTLGTQHPKVEAAQAALEAARREIQQRDKQFQALRKALQRSGMRRFSVPSEASPGSNVGELSRRAEQTRVFRNRVDEESTGTRIFRGEAARQQWIEARKRRALGLSPKFVLGQSDLNRELEAARKRERDSLSRQFTADRVIFTSGKALGSNLRQELNALPPAQREALVRKLPRALTQAEVAFEEARRSVDENGKRLNAAQRQQRLDEVKRLQEQIRAELDQLRAKGSAGVPSGNEVR